MEAGRMAQRGIARMSQGGAVLTVHLFSFSYRLRGIPPDEGGNGGGFVFDCRCLPNPHWDEALRPYAGHEPPIVAFMARHPEVAAFVGHAEALVLQAARCYEADGRERLMVSCGCTGGRHRSVYVAERLAAALRAAGIPVVLQHLDLQRAAAENGAEGGPCAP
jgi:RNase adaptor protein for sRNA GlmZ degradation